MKTYDAYLFDWDGTLANSHAMWLRIVHKQLARYGIQLSDQEVVQQLFGRYDEGMQELGFKGEELERLGNEMHATGAQNMWLVELYPGARQVLEELAARSRKLALITATYRDIIELAITKHELVNRFDAIVAGNEVKQQKPEPEGIRTALKALAVAPNRAIMIGDSKKDILAGQNGGTDTLLFYPPEHKTQHDLAELTRCNPTYTVRSWRELLDQL